MLPYTQGSRSIHRENHLVRSSTVSLGTSSPRSDSHQEKLLPACVMAQGYKSGDGILSGISPFHPVRFGTGYSSLCFPGTRATAGVGIPHKQPLAVGWKHQLVGQKFFCMSAWACSGFKATGSSHPGWRTQRAVMSWQLVEQPGSCCPRSNTAQSWLGLGLWELHRGRGEIHLELGFCKTREAVSSTGG